MSSTIELLIRISHWRLGSVEQCLCSIKSRFKQVFGQSDDTLSLIKLPLTDQTIPSCELSNLGASIPASSSLPND